MFYTLNWEGQDEKSRKIIYASSKNIFQKRIVAEMWYLRNQGT